MIDRMDRVAEQIKREISVILQEEINDPRIKNIAISKVVVTRDLRLAKIYYDVFAEKEEKDRIAQGLKKASSFMRGELARRLTLKFIPSLSFREDKAEEQKESMEKIFEDVEKELESSDEASGKDTGDE